MPELPEITTITNQLKKEIVGSTITGVQVVGNYKIQFNSLELVGRKVAGVKRIAKNIVLELKKDKPFPKVYPSGNLAGESVYLVVHLAMTGRLLLRDSGATVDPWTRLVFTVQPDGLNGTRRVRELRFCDSRMFGFVRLMNNDELTQYISKYGPDALDEMLTPEMFLSQLKKKRTEVKRALLEQDLIAGAGNIYVNDSLWMAGIHPQTSTQQVTEEQATRLLTALKLILTESTGHRGSTLGDRMYIDIYGNEGTHQNYFRVFGKVGQACSRCRTIIEYIDIGGRGTFFCPVCQVRTNSVDSESQKDGTYPAQLSFRP